MATSCLNVDVIGSTNECHEINRSQELVSCVRTAFKIEKAKAEREREERIHHSNNNSTNVSMNKSFYDSIQMDDLKLHSNTYSSSSSSSNEYNGWVEDAETICHVLDSRLVKLSKLVKKSTSQVQQDYTNDIHVLVQEFQTISSRDLLPLLQQLATIATTETKSVQLHYKYIATHLQSQAALKTKSLEQIMTLRGNLLKQYHQARQRLLHTNKNKKQTTNTTTTTTTTNTVPFPTRKPPPRNTNQLTSPLFTTIPTTTTNNNSNNQKHNYKKQPQKYDVFHQNPNKSSNHTTTNNKNNYAASSSSVGYGAGAYDSFYASSTSNNNQLRRRGTASSTTDPPPQQQQQQLYKTRQKSRADMARQTESKLAELSSLFGKMSTLIVKQGETLEKIEDDVEAAVDYVNEGHEQIITLYEITRNNRSLIIKVFAILIGLILFMRFY